mgnify:CR=1 FL=1
MDPYVIIVAGGNGLRSGSVIPKQFSDVGGKPLLLYSLEAFHMALPGARIILVLSPNHRLYWETILKDYPLGKTIELAEAGNHRFFSVQNGLAKVPENVMVGIHDAARPYVSTELILKVFKEAETHGCCVPSLQPSESVRLIQNHDNYSIDRSCVRLIQTPQVFHSTLLKKAYKKEYSECFTDDASVWESDGNKVYLSDGEVGYVKVTTPYDLRMAECLLSCQKGINLRSFSTSES